MLLDREAEQRELDLLIQHARAGRSGAVVLRGEPGVGKSALLGYAAERAGPMRVLRATGIETEAELAFGGLHALLRPLAGRLDAQPGRYAALQAALGLADHEAAPGRLAVAVATHELLVTVAEQQPLLLLVDDVQWLDRPTLDALTFAIRRLGHDPVACILASRPDAPAVGGIAVRDLAGLSPRAARQLVEAVTGTAPAAEVAALLHYETGGNPLALAEIARAMTRKQLAGEDIAGVPLEPGAAIRQRFSARLDRLDPAARTALLVAAAGGRCPAEAVTAASARLGGGRAGALDEAEAAGLIRLSAGGVEFAHPLLRSVAYHSAPPAERRSAHRALAAVLASTDPDRAAWQLAGAATGRDDAAGDALDAAASRAAGRGAPLVAAAAWERAAQLSAAPGTRAARYVAAAEAALRGGDADRARRLASNSPAAQQPRWQARMLAVNGRLDLAAGKMTTAQQALRAAADLIAGTDPRLAAELLGESVWAATEAGLDEEASQAAEQMSKLAERADETARFLADLACGQLAWIRGDPELGMVLTQRAAARLAAHPALASSAGRQLDVAGAYSSLGDHPRAWPYAERAVELARSTGAAGQLPDALAGAASIAAETGKWLQALALGSQALELAQATGQQFLACDALITLASVEAAQGRGEDCLRHVGEADRLASELGLHQSQLLARRQRALLELGTGQLEEAIEHYEALRRLAARWDISHPWYSPIADLIEAYARAGALDTARVLLPEFLAQVPGDANPLPAARAARCQGIVTAENYDAHFQKAISLQEQFTHAFQHARTLLCYGERLRRARRRRDARVRLRAAIEIFDRLDARPWADRARAEINATGETIGQHGPDGERLTPQELQIALLVTQGRTNAEIGRAIFLSTRTVEFHLSRAYRKLGISSRTELAGRLAGAAQDPSQPDVSIPTTRQNSQLCTATTAAGQESEADRIGGYTRPSADRR
jgi:DNA-binding CsgD family transcriptional regulator